MSEAEITDLLLQAVDAVLQVVAIYFTIVSAYIGALYYFLNQAPPLMRLVAFAFMSGALGFLGITIVAIERTTSGLVRALEFLPQRVAEPPPTLLYFGLDVLFRGHTQDAVMTGLELAVMAGWLMAFSIYAALFYLTFGHNWRRF